MNNPIKTTYNKKKLALVWLIAALVGFMLASISHSQFVLIELVKLDIKISLIRWISHTAEDIAGLAIGYGSVIAVAFLLAFTVMAKINKWLNIPSKPLFFVAGALSIATTLLAMQPLLNVTLIAGSRSLLGFSVQALAGGMGGLTFAWLLPWAANKTELTDNIA
ncbi:MAG: hypothetical protein V2I33_15370 [Kangiellaceae bacterium]|jgi:hypothetical protein|nr:hypothetical protein [Kangiellaceae bacterium]